MADKLKYSSNEFVSKTRDSLSKAVRLILGHLARVKAYHLAFPLDADYTLMYDRTLIVANDVETKYNLINVAQGAQEGQRELVQEHLVSIKGKDGLAHDWYDRTKVKYYRTNKPRFVAIWEDGLEPFNGTIAVTIAALKNLSDKIGADADPDMIAIKGEVDAEYAIINPGRLDQKTKMETTGIRTRAAMAAGVIAMRMEYRNASKMMEKFDENIDNIQESFHDMELLLDKQQTEWNLTLDSHEEKDVAKRTVVYDTPFKAKVIGGAAKMYLGSFAGAMDSTAVDLVDNIELNFIASAFGITDYSQHCHVTVVNQSGAVITFKLDLD